MFCAYFFVKSKKFQLFRKTSYFVLDVKFQIRALWKTTIFLHHFANIWFWNGWVCFPETQKGCFSWSKLQNECKCKMHISKWIASLSLCLSPTFLEVINSQFRKEIRVELWKDLAVFILHLTYLLNALFLLKNCTLISHMSLASFMPYGFH